MKRCTSVRKREEHQRITKARLRLPNKYLSFWKMQPITSIYLSDFWEKRNTSIAMNQLRTNKSVSWIFYFSIIDFLIFGKTDFIARYGIWISDDNYPTRPQIKILFLVDWLNAGCTMMIANCIAIKIQSDVALVVSKMKAIKHAVLWKSQGYRLAKLTAISIINLPRKMLKAWNQRAHRCTYNFILIHDRNSNEFWIPG